MMTTLHYCLLLTLYSPSMTGIPGLLVTDQLNTYLTLSNYEKDPLVLQ